MSPLASISPTSRISAPSTPPSPAAMLRAEFCATTEAIEALLPAWRALLDAGAAASPGADPTRFFDTIAAARGAARPAALAVFEGDRLRAIVAGRCERTPIRCRIGYVKIRTPRLRTFKAMYGGVITDGEPAVAEFVAKSMLELLDNGPVECVFTNKLDLAGPIMQGVLHDRRAVRREVRPHWVTDLVPHSYEQTMSGHSSKHRSNLRRLDRKLCAHFEDQIELRIVTDAAEAPFYAEAMRAIFEKTYKAGIARDQMEGQDWALALRSRAEAGELRSYLLMAGGEPIAYQTGTLHRGVYYAEGTAYLPEHQSLRPGTVLMMRVMQDLCDQGAHVIDWGFGDAEYKRLYGSRQWDEAACHVYGAGWRARIARWIDQAVVGAAVRSKRVAGDGLTSRIRRRWRDRASRASDS